MSEITKGAPADFLTMFLKSSPDGLLAFDRDLRFILWNPTMEKMAGLPASQVLGKVIWDVVPFLKEIGEDEYIYRTLEGIQTTSIHRPFHVPSTGKSGFFDGSYTPVRDENGKVMGGMVMIRDVTERMLRDVNDEIFQKIVDSIPQIMWVSDDTTNVLYYNQSWYDYTGYDRNDLKIGEKWPAVVHPDDLPAIYELAARSNKDGTPFAGEYRLRGKNGEYRWFYGRAESIKDLSTKNIRKIGTAIDIHEKKIAEQEAKAFNQRFRELVERTPYSFLIYSLNGTCIYANAAWEKSGMGRRDQVVGFNLLTNEAVQQTSAYPLLQRAFKGETVVLPDAMSVPQSYGLNGDARWVRTTFFPLHNYAGKFIEVAAVIEDVTADLEAKTRSEALSEASKALASSLNIETIAKNITSLCVKQIADICIFDLMETEGVFRRLSVSSAYPDDVDVIKRMMTMPPSSREPGHPPWRAYLEKKTIRVTPDAPEEYVKQADMSPERKKMILQAKHKSSVSMPLLTRGQILGVLTLICDSRSGKDFVKTEVRWLEELSERIASAIENARLYQSSKQAVVARDTFLSTASHELKTPLTALQLQVQLIARASMSQIQNAEASARVKRITLQTDRQIHRLSRLVDDMLDISRIASGKLKVEPESMNLTELTLEVIEKLQPLAADFDTHVICECRACDAVYGEWDGVRIEQVLNNLLTNAFRYGGQKPIEVRVWEEGEFAFVSIRDQGKGISKSDQTRIFERFERADKSDLAGGFGIGLFIAREIVSLHHGSISVVSDLGQGSTFTVKLPLHPPVSTGDA